MLGVRGVVGAATRRLVMTVVLLAQDVSEELDGIVQDTNVILGPVFTLGRMLGPRLVGGQWRRRVARGRRRGDGLVVRRWKRIRIDGRRSRGRR